MIIHKKPHIELETKVTLTNEGAGFFVNKGYRLRKISTADGGIQFGVKLAKISPDSLQHLIRIGYFSSLETSHVEFTTIRSDLMDLSKLAIFGFLYKRFDKEVFDILIKSSLVKVWNRSNPGRVIDERTRINDNNLKSVLSKNSALLQSIRKSITTPVVKTIMSNTSLLVDEKNAMIFLSDKFLDNIRSFIWLILMKFSYDKECKVLIGKIRECLELYIQRSSIADYLTLLLTELMMSAEALNIQNFAKRDGDFGINVEKILLDPVKRNSLLEEMKTARADLVIGWRFGNPSATSINSDDKLQVVVYNSEIDYLDFKEKFSESIESESDSSLQEFYHNTSVGNPELGLQYQGYLREACSRVGLRFTSKVGMVRDGALSITLTVRF